MTILPAIDLKKGNCVRLVQGDFNQLTNYNLDPINQAREFMDCGFSYLHIVDLDGAQTGSQENLPIIKRLASNPSLSLEVGGGIRSIKKASEMLELGVTRIIVGTALFETPNFLPELQSNFDPDQIVLGLDFKTIEDQQIIFTHGWQNQSSVNLTEFLNTYSYFSNILATDISLDGAMKGPSVKAYQHIIETFPSINLIASGGISSIQDIDAVQTLGCKEVVVGKAIYEHAISLKELSNAM
ncbi:1-(5-phosphoribosyl)-5-[(5-phosphoribosylamino)methylideneamino]imidazole-4-carboxamide isomerase [Gammaproteobacteria bacterium]|nr:1-(5-phosphoribosyl)-5-[(5-phosphoribosylamino)methylideneamino]imidazole-4-carboxamide isomerase [Gammaproteobacteria bacterium]